MFDMLIAGLLVLAVATLILGSLYSIVRNVQHARIYRENLDARLSELRLNRLLGLFGITTIDYLHRESVVGIVKQMRDCSACDVQSQCDRALDGGAATGEFSFCPNFGALQTHAELAA